MQRPQIVVLGGGIAGLAFSLRFRQLGGKCLVLEQRTVTGQEGLGFILLENGLKAIDKLGIKSEVVSKGIKIQHYGQRDEFGIPCVGESIGEAIGMRRSHFIDALIAYTPDDDLIFNQQFKHFKYNDNGFAIAAEMSSGEVFVGDLFLGCDGIRSRVRQEVFPNARLADVAVKELVSIVDAPYLVKRLKRRFFKTQTDFGGLSVGVVPVDASTVVWYIQYDANQYEIPSTNYWYKLKAVKNIIGSWPDPIPELIESTDFDKSYTWQSTYLHPLSCYFNNNVVLLGDAAHAMLTFTSQGVNGAIEDAIYLAEHLIDTSESQWPDIFRRYSNDRKKTVEQYLKQGLALQKYFLEPTDNSFKVPLAM